MSLPGVSIAKGYAQIVSDVSVDVSDVSEVCINIAINIFNNIK
jgi:hypothetical protein